MYVVSVCLPWIIINYSGRQQLFIYLFLNVLEGLSINNVFLLIWLLPQPQTKTDEITYLFTKTGPPLVLVDFISCMKHLNLQILIDPRVEVTL